MSNVLTKRAGTSLVRFIGKRARYAPTMMSPRLRVGMALGKYAWQNRRGIMKTARKIMYRGKLARFRNKQRTSIAARQSLYWCFTLNNYTDDEQ